MADPAAVPRPPFAVVSRQRLTDRVLATGPGGVCLVGAPPGYGATTAVSQALRGGADAVQWVPVADGADPIAALAAALGVADDAAAAMTWALNERGPGWVVLDALRAAPEAAWQALLDVVAELGPQTRLCLITHDAAPSPALVRANAPGSTHLSEADLRCTVDESVQVLHLWQPDLDIEVVSEVVQAAEGWMAALVAAGAQARHGGLTDGWLQGPGAALLFRAWLAGLPADLRQFLLRTAVLDTLSADLAAAVAERPDAGSLLLELEARAAYLTPLETPPGMTGRWWRRHPLLGSALRQHGGPDLTRRHSLAADWYAATPDVDAALHHLLEAGRTADAGRHLSRYESSMLADGRAERVLDWYGKLADGPSNRLDTLLRIGWGRVLSFDLHGAEASLAQLEAEIAATGAEGAAIGAPVGQAAMLRAYIAMARADPAGMVAAGTAAAAALAPEAVSDAGQLAPLVAAQGLLWSGRYEAAAAAVAAIRDRPMPHELLRECRLAGLRAMCAAAVGRVREADAHARRTAQWLGRQGLDPISLPQYNPVTAQSLVALEMGDLERSLQLAGQVADVAQANGHVGDQVWAMLALARCAAAAGDVGAALRTVGAAREAATQATVGSAMTVPLDLWQARFRIAAGDVVRAERIIRSLPPSAERTLLWAELSPGSQASGARRTVEALAPATSRVACDKHLLLASMHLRTSRRMAEGHLRKAAEIAHDHGMGLLLLGADDATLGLAREMAVHEQDGAVAWLLDRARACRAPSVADTDPPRAAALTRGDLQLLAMLPSRASNAEIAATLGISVNTVKTRLKRLYQRLEASNRDEAVRRAVQRGLLPEHAVRIF